MGYLEIIVSILAPLIGLANFRKTWHEGTTKKLEKKKLEIEIRRMKRGG